ncbi:alpha/beta hydrolase family protein [Micromonospora pisi]|uniref:Alpha/beta hydrolase family protein n=1 Tax=Micromonospora pisi TaxID=589240 RepID=A0A495JBX2_9ACTN|nr:alpha/beta hydrolase [Micromonospora pisi]RKR86496.1 alpha/beta hydrolase family protein [Micromonospora pisi]
MSLPSLVLVPGAWHKPEHLARLIDELRDVDIHTVALASSGDDPAKLGDMHQDASLIEKAVAAIDGPVVVVAHSYGGIPTSQGLVGADNVRRIVYLAAFQIEVGESLLSSAGGSPAPWWKIHHAGADGYVEAMNPEDVFYGDVDPDIARQAVAQLGYQSYLSKTQEQTQAAWHTIPSTYVICEADNALPPFAQEHFANRAGRVTRMATSHSPFLSQPAELARIIRDELASA